MSALSTKCFESDFTVRFIDLKIVLYAMLHFMTSQNYSSIVLTDS